MSGRRTLSGPWSGALLAVIGFWWGAYVAPELVSIAFPGVLPGERIPEWLDAEVNDSLTNALSAALLAAAAGLMAANAVRDFRASASRIATTGWSVLAGVILLVCIAELTEAHIDGPVALGRALFGRQALLPSWPILLAPMIGTFVALMALFMWRVDHPPSVRRLLGLGFGLWIMVLVHEVIQPYALLRFGSSLPRVLEETLEISGTMCLIVAALATRGRASPGLRWRTPFVRSTLLVASLSAIAVALLYHAPVFDTRAHSPPGTFQIMLQDQGSITQEFNEPLFPTDRIDVRMATRDPNGTSTTVAWRIRSDETPIREGHVQVVSQPKHLSMYQLTFAPLIETADQKLNLQLVAEASEGAHLHIGATKLNSDDGFRLWTNGDIQPRGHRIEYVVFSTPEPTRAKLAALWHVVSEDWRYPATMLYFAVSLVLLVFTPLVLVRS